MPQERSTLHPTLALNTKVEDDFVAPLTAMRGALEILRDVSELSDEERSQFIDTALRGCAKLETSVADLARSVYAAGQAAQDEPVGQGVCAPFAHADRIRLLEDDEIIEVDYSEYVFKNSDMVNEFHDAIDDLVEQTGRDWYFLVNFHHCSIWPEAWVAFAHRGKKINVNYSLGTVRYAIHEPSEDPNVSESLDPNLFGSRDAALGEINRMKAAAAA